jgi:hypothetical protein
MGKFVKVLWVLVSIFFFALPSMGAGVPEGIIGVWSDESGHSIFEFRRNGKMIILSNRDRWGNIDSTMYDFNIEGEKIWWGLRDYGLILMEESGLTWKRGAVHDEHGRALTRVRGAAPTRVTQQQRTQQRVQSQQTTKTGSEASEQQRAQIEQERIEREREIREWRERISAPNLQRLVFRTPDGNVDIQVGKPFLRGSNFTLEGKSVVIGSGRPDRRSGFFFINEQRMGSFVLRASGRDMVISEITIHNTSDLGFGVFDIR